MPRAKVALPVEVSINDTKQSVTLVQVSRTGAKLRGVRSVAVGDQLIFKAAEVHAVGEAIRVDGDECAIEFDTPIAATEVSSLNRLAD